MSQRDRKEVSKLDAIMQWSKLGHVKAGKQSSKEVITSLTNPVCRQGGWSYWRGGEEGPGTLGTEPLSWQSLVAEPWEAPPPSPSSLPLVGVF